MYTLMVITYPLIHQYQGTKEEIQEIIDKNEFKRVDCQVYKQGDSKNPITSEFKFKNKF